MYTARAGAGQNAYDSGRPIPATRKKRMRMRIAAAATGRAARALACAALSGCLVAAASAAPWSGVRSVDVADPQYQMTAFTLAVPTGWKFAGAMVRDSGCHGKGASLKSTSQSPDGQMALYYMPGFRWSWTTNVFMRAAMEKAHCPDIDIDNAASFLINIAVPNLEPKAIIVSVQPLEAAGQASLAAQLQQQRQSNAAAAARYGLKPQQLSLSGARVRIRFVANGK